MRDGHGRCVAGFILTNLNEVIGLYELQCNIGVFFGFFFGCTTEHMCYAVIVEIHAAVCAVKPAVTQAADWKWTG